MTTDIRERVAEVLAKKIVGNDEFYTQLRLEAADVLLEAFPRLAETDDVTRAKAVREAASYIDRITRNGLISKKNVLGDLEAAAYRMEHGMTARGNTRRRAGVWEVCE